MPYHSAIMYEEVSVKSEYNSERWDEIILAVCNPMSLG
jgi:hypothetical protein